uniref:Glyco_transf_7N domain-containing protein n=1 Tax=Macrostomum lignano TaxID=282301 RepID=A0A1I8FMV6_9PLAT
ATPSSSSGSSASGAVSVNWSELPCIKESHSPAGWPIQFACVSRGPAGLLGNKIPVKSDPSLAPTWAELQSTLSYIRHGGCSRNTALLGNELPLLCRNSSTIEYLSPSNRRAPRDSNRGLLFNIGFVESAKIFPAYCYIFHDVDLLPENDHNMYRCGANPRHLGAEISSFGYKTALRRLFWRRLRPHGRTVPENERLPKYLLRLGPPRTTILASRVAWAGYKVARYPPRHRQYLEQSKKALEQEDGLNSMQYNVIGVQDRQLVYFISVEISEEAIRRRAVGFDVAAENETQAKRQ